MSPRRPTAPSPSSPTSTAPTPPDRARSTDLTGEEQGREPSSVSEAGADADVEVEEPTKAREEQGAVSEDGDEDLQPVPVDVALDVEELDADLFRSKSLWQPARARGVFGGHVIGMAVASAAKTIRPGLTLHSLHCYFLLAANAHVPIIYKVVRVRDGGSYCTRRVDAQQRGRCIYTMMLSYQVPEPAQPVFAIPLPAAGAGAEGAQLPTPQPASASTPPPQSGSPPPPPAPRSSHPPASAQFLPLSSSFTRSPTPNSIIASLPAPEHSPLNEQRYVDVLRGPKRAHLHPRLVAALEAAVRDRVRSPVEIRNALPGMYDAVGLPEEGYEQAFWLRTREPVAAAAGGATATAAGASPPSKSETEAAAAAASLATLEAHKAALAYASDFQFLSTIPKALGNSTNIRMMASLDHSMWFYHAFDVHEWLLFVMQAQAASNGRGVVLGRIYRRDGTLVAVVAQEGMVREDLERGGRGKGKGKAREEGKL